MKDQYQLVIYSPKSHREVLASFTSDTPFQAIGKGDTLRNFRFPDTEAEILFRVVTVEHIIWQLSNGQVNHKVCVYTEQIEDTWESRFPEG